MMRTVMGCALLLGWTVVSPALEVGLELDNTTALQFEPVMAIVTIVNDTSYPFVVTPGRESGTAHVEFRVTHGPDNTVRRISKEHAVTRLRAMPDEKGSTMLDLTHFHSMQKEGQYFIQVRVQWKGRVFLSKRVLLDIVPGIKIASVEKLVPAYMDLTREYSLRYWNRDRHDQLFLRVDQKETQTNYGVFPLGRLIRLTKPVLRVDRKGLVTVVHQASPNLYIRTVFLSSEDGVEFLDQTFTDPDGNDVRPRLP